MPDGKYCAFVAAGKYGRSECVRYCELWDVDNKQCLEVTKAEIEIQKFELEEKKVEFLKRIVELLEGLSAEKVAGLINRF